MTFRFEDENFKLPLQTSGRRRFAKTLGLAGAAGVLASCAGMGGDIASTKKLGRVAVVGAGPAG